MGESNKRALRRSHKKRMIDKAKKIFRTIFGNDVESAEHRALRAADNLKECSCWMCGNPRKYLKHGDEKIYDKRHKIEETED